MDEVPDFISSALAAIEGGDDLMGGSLLDLPPGSQGDETPTWLQSDSGTPSRVASGQSAMTDMSMLHSIWGAVPSAAADNQFAPSPDRAQSDDVFFLPPADDDFPPTDIDFDKAFAELQRSVSGEAQAVDAQRSNTASNTEQVARAPSQGTGTTSAAAPLTAEELERQMMAMALSGQPDAPAAVDTAPKPEVQAEAKSASAQAETSGAASLAKLVAGMSYANAAGSAATTTSETHLASAATQQQDVSEEQSEQTKPEPSASLQDEGSELKPGEDTGSEASQQLQPEGIPQGIQITLPMVQMEEQRLRQYLAQVSQAVGSHQFRMGMHQQAVKNLIGAISRMQQMAASTGKNATFAIRQAQQALLAHQQQIHALDMRLRQAAMAQNQAQAFFQNEVVARLPLADQETFHDNRAQQLRQQMQHLGQQIDGMTAQINDLMTRISAIQLEDGQNKTSGQETESSSPASPDEGEPKDTNDAKDETEKAESGAETKQGPPPTAAMEKHQLLRMLAMLDSQRKAALSTRNQMRNEMNNIMYCLRNVRRALYPEHAARSRREQYNNLMTPFEKDRIIRIQLLQLNSDNPYVDDYYFNKTQQFRAQQHASQSGRPVQVPIVRPNAQAHRLAGSHRTYVPPVEDKGALGTIRAFDIKTPRTLIAAMHGETEEVKSDDPIAARRKLYRRALSLIEAGYDHLLALQDINLQLEVTPPNHAQELLQQREQRIKQAAETLNLLAIGAPPDRAKAQAFVSIMCVNKGKALFARLLLLLGPTETTAGILTLMQTLPVLTAPNTGLSQPANQFEQMAEVVLPAVQHASSRLPLQALIDIVRGQSDTLPEPKGLGLHVLNKVGASIMLAIFRQADLQLSQRPPQQLVAAWMEHLSKYAERAVPILREVLRMQADKADSAFAAPLAWNIASVLSAHCGPDVARHCKQELISFAPKPDDQSADAAAKSFASLVKDL